MDLDTTRKKDSYENILNSFEDQEIDILVGTQMISKGLDFSTVKHERRCDYETLFCPKISCS